MKLVIALLPLLAFASARHWNFQTEDANSAAYRLGVAFTNAAKEQSNEPFSDYFANSFLYTHCAYKINKDELLEAYSSYYPNGATDFQFEIRSATWGNNGGLIINAFISGASMSSDVVAIAEPNPNLIGKFDFTSITAVKTCGTRRRYGERSIYFN